MFGAKRVVITLQSIDRTATNKSRINAGRTFMTLRTLPGRPTEVLATSVGSGIFGNFIPQLERCREVFRDLQRGCDLLQ